MLAAAAWWTVYYGFVATAHALPNAHAAIALLLAAVVGFGLVGKLAMGEAPEPNRKGPRGLRASDFVGLALLLPAYPIGAALQRAVEKAMGASTSPPALANTGDLLEIAGAPSLEALIVVAVALPVVEEWFYRGLILPGLARGGRVRGLAWSSAIAAVAMAGFPDSTGVWIGLLACASLWSFLLGVVRLATGSLLASMLLRAGLASAWAADRLIWGNTPSGATTLAAASISVVVGVAIFRRGLLRGRLDAGAADALPVAEREPAPARPRIAVPLVGLAMGAGMLVAECVVVLRGILETFGGTGIWKELTQSLIGYMTAGALIDVLLQLVLPARLRASRVWRALPIAVVIFLVERRYGAWGIVAWAVVPVALAWAAATHLRWSRPLAVAMSFVAVIAALPARATTAEAPQGAPRAGSPSMAVVVLDTVRRDHCSLYGYGRPTTPNLDALARRGVRMDNAYSASCWSVESHASLFTGLLPHNHGATFEHMRLVGRHPTMASVLAAKGYETAAFSGNPYVTAATGMARGFSIFLDLWRPFVMRRGLAAMQVGASLGSKPSDKGGSAVVAETRRWLKHRDASRPYFLFVNFMEAHSPYQDAPLAAKFADAALDRGDLETIGRESHDAQWLGSRVRKESMQTTIDLMDGATASADAYLGELLAALGEDTIVVVLSDHGDLIGEHGLYGHMTGLYEPLIRVPMVFAGRGLTRGASVGGTVSTIDIMPTLLTLAGVETPALDGVEFSAALRGGPAPPARPAIAEHYRNPALGLWSGNRSAEEIDRLRARRMAVVDGSRKRVVAEDGSDVGYNLATDPSETKPLPGASIGLAATAPPAPGATGAVEMDAAQLEMLRSLGYVK